MRRALAVALLSATLALAGCTTAPAQQRLPYGWTVEASEHAAEKLDPGEFWMVLFSGAPQAVPVLNETPSCPPDFVFDINQDNRSFAHQANLTMPDDPQAVIAQDIPSADGSDCEWSYKFDAGPHAEVGIPFLNLTIDVHPDGTIVAGSAGGNATIEQGRRLHIVGSADRDGRSYVWDYTLQSLGAWKTSDILSSDTDPAED